MRVAVLGAAGAALLGATLAITPLDTVGAPVRAPGACGNGAGGSCERLASILAPQAGPAGQAAAVPALAAPVSIAPAPALAAGPSDALPAPHPVAAQVIAPGLAPRPGVPSAAVPGLGVPGVPGQTTVPGLGVPGVGAPGIPGLPGTDISGYDLPGLLNQAYALVNGVVGADVAASTIGPITSGVLGAAGIVAGVGGSGLNRADNPGVFEPAQRQRHRQRPRGSRQTGLDAGTHRRYGAITGGESPGTTGESPRPTWSRGDGTSRGGSTPATEYPRACGRSQGPAAAPTAAAATAAPTTVSPGAVRAVDGLLPALHIAPVLAGSTPRSAA